MHIYVGINTIEHSGNQYSVNMCRIALHICGTLCQPWAIIEIKSSVKVAALNAYHGDKTGSKFVNK